MNALTDEQITQALGELNGWSRDGDKLTKTYQLDSYPAGLAFATAAGIACDGLGHHPDMYVGYKKVTVEFTTHDAGSKITEKDVEAARAVEALGYPKP